MLSRSLAVLLAVLAILVPVPVYAGGNSAGPGGNVGCGTSGCEIEVGTPGKPGGSGDGNGGGGGGSGGGNPCTYEAANPGPEAIAAVGGQPAGPGGWYFRHCVSPDGEVGFGALMWLAAPPPVISPAVLAQVARKRLDLPTVVVKVNPDASTMVNVPVWLALTGGWQQRSSTASVPGVSVTVTATPSRVTWRMGDGGSVVCHGPGTVYRPGVDDPYAASPTCGYGFRQASGSGTFTVTATVTYTVTWSGGGQSGTIGDLTATGTTALRVGESQAIITN